MPIITVSHLDKYFDDLHVLRDVCFEVTPREVVCIIGRSGSGKSTLLRCLNFLETPDFGVVEIDGVRIECGGHGRAWRKHVHDLRPVSYTHPSPRDRTRSPMPSSA